MRQDKLSAKAEEMTFIGYETNTKGWRFWSQQQHILFISTHATFDETWFLSCSRKNVDKLAFMPAEDTAIDSPEEHDQEKRNPDPPPQHVLINIPDLGPQFWTRSPSRPPSSLPSSSESSHHRSELPPLWLPLSTPDLPNETLNKPLSPLNPGIKRDKCYVKCTKGLLHTAETRQVILMKRLTSF